MKESIQSHIKKARKHLDKIRQNVSHRPSPFEGMTKDEDFLVPFELGAKYESKGLKPADAFIAAYAGCVGADILAT